MRSLYSPIFAFIILITKASSPDNDCLGQKYIDFANGIVPSTDNVPYRFVFVDQPEPNKIYEHGTKMKITCKPSSYFAYPTESKSLICENGEIQQDDVSIYNHCIQNHQCSAAYFDRDWIINGYRLDSKIKNLMSDGPLISNSIGYSQKIENTLNKYGKQQLPATIQSKYLSSKTSNSDYSTYPPLLLLTCDILYTSFTANSDKNVFKSNAFCVNKVGWKTAKWSMGESIKTWKDLQYSCIPIVKLSIKKAPPPQGCTVLSQDRAECMSYEKFCAWDELQKFKPPFDIKKVDIQICTKQCSPWSCYSALTMPINCADKTTIKDCTKLIPSFSYWCEWDTKEQICLDKTIKENAEDYPIAIDICSTDNYKCRISESKEYWEKQQEIFSGNIEKLNEIKFGYQYKLFGIRHIVEPLSLLTKMSGSVITTIRASHEINNNDPTEVTLDAGVDIEPNQIDRKFGKLTRAKYQTLNKFYKLNALKSQSGKSSVIDVDYEYVTIELKSDEIEVNSEPISFSLQTFTSSDCKRCKLEKAKQSGIGARINTITNTLYVIDPTENSDKAMVSLQFPSMNKANIKLKLKLDIEPAPERCGKHDIGCFIILEPVMNDVASSLFEFKCTLPVRARLLGFVIFYI